MTVITVTNAGASTSPIVWVTMSVWTRSPIYTHVTVPGGMGLGRTFPQGADNATATITGRAPRNAAGQAAYDALPGARVTVSDGVTERSGIVTSLTPQDQSPAWIYFTMSVTED